MKALSIRQPWAWATATGAHRVRMRGMGSDRCLLCRADGYSGARCPYADPWAIPGCLGLILADVEPLAEPVPFKGALGFFDVPDGTVPS